MSAEFERIEVEQRGPVLHVWLDRPERRNAVDDRMLREVGDLFTSLETAFDTRVVVLGGRGKSFCAGADLKPAPSDPGLPEPGERERRWLGQLGRRACRAIEACEVVTLARVHGHAVGGGVCLALSCDFRLASRDTIFRVPEVHLGAPLSWSGIPRLIHEIGAARAREVLLLCRDVDADTAERWGLIHRAVDPAALDDEVERWVAELVDKPELAVHITKTQLRGYERGAALGDLSEADGDMIARAGRSSAMRERFTLDGARRKRT